MSLLESKRKNADLLLYRIINSQLLIEQNMLIELKTHQDS